MESGKKVEKGGVYCCLYHQKNKIKIKAGSILPECNFVGLKCSGYWHFLKELKEKTRKESYETTNKRRYYNKKKSDQELYPI
jgi:hypothetical protein